MYLFLANVIRVKPGFNPLDQVNFLDDKKTGSYEGLDYLVLIPLIRSIVQICQKASPVILLWHGFGEL
jgi:hypothetical protein